MTKTIDYYNINSQAFYDSTVDVDMGALYVPFEQYLPRGGAVLDCGCGSGRDSLHFLQEGYQVSALDASAELCKKVRELTGGAVPVRQMFFQELEDVECYDGIWACASLLHVPREELPYIFELLHTALKSYGVLYCSFKYGSGEEEHNGRFFTNMEEAAFFQLMGKVCNFSVLNFWITEDARPGRESEHWLNAVLRKEIL